MSNLVDKVTIRTCNLTSVIISFEESSIKASIISILHVENGAQFLDATSV